MNSPRLRMSGIHKCFGATLALNGVSLEAHSGRVLALVGENGAGKSTLMKVLSGVYPPDKGKIEFDGQSFRPADPLAARRAGVAMIYQELSIAPHLSVAENVMLGVEPQRFGLIDRSQMRSAARHALSQMGRSDLYLDMPAGDLTVAEQQLVEIARALVVGAKLLVLDEPTSSMGSEDVERLFTLVEHLRDQGLAVIYISHFLEEVMRIADRVVVLRDGQTVGGGNIDEVTTDQIITLMVGRKVDELYPRSPRAPGKVVLELDALAGVLKPQEATLRLRRGEVFGIAGLVGAGRTEMLRAVFGLDPVARGCVHLAGFAGPGSPSKRWRQAVGYVSEDRKGEGLALTMTIADNMTLSKLSPLGPFVLVDPRKQNAVTRKWIKQFGIRCQAPSQSIGDLSGGNQQKVAIARLLHHDAEVLLLDEPTRGVDVASKVEIYRVIDQLACDGKAILLVSSYLPELLGVCDRVAVMCRGRLGTARPVEDWDEHRLMVEATGREAFV